MNFPNATSPEAPATRDRLGRPARDLRISVTDRCNLRCAYCMPEECFGSDYAFLTRADLLTFEEIARVARAAVSLGVRKIRVTGGEPLLRKDLPVLVGMLSAIPGVEDLALTTNGLLLPQLAAPLRAAGLDRVTVSLDSLDDATLARMSGRPIATAEVLAGIGAARAAGFKTIKVNCVVQRGENEDQVLPLASYFRGTGVTIRFIEFMDTGTRNGWRLDTVVPSSELRDAIYARYPLVPVEPAIRGEVARRYRYADGQGEVGFITSVTQPFCGDCTRLRLAPDGSVYTCLFARHGHPLKPLLRAGAGERDIADWLRGVWRIRDDRYSEERTEETAGRDKVEMHHIGG
jgi:GTP 3',8-cyclase